VISMTTNLFLLPYWAPAFQRVPLSLRPLGEAYALKEHRRARELSQSPGSERKIWMDGSCPRTCSGDQVRPRQDSVGASGPLACGDRPLTG
jgi:hypothetical protein